MPYETLAQTFRAQAIRDALLWAHWFYGDSTHQGLGPWTCCDQVVKEQ